MFRKVISKGFASRLFTSLTHEHKIEPLTDQFKRLENNPKFFRSNNEMDIKKSS
jgi:hypothetical protein